ncbi:UNVERIFIED_CONTAM: hypothetical protein FKN15_010687 [Acipenser sinensis]
MTRIPWFHTCTSFKVNMPLSDKHPLCVRCLGVQHAAEVTYRHGDRRSVSHSRAVSSPRGPIPAPPGLTEPLAGDPLLSGSCAKTQARRVKRSRQAKDIIYLKEQMSQVLELLSRQQTPAAPVEVPAPLPPTPTSAPRSPMGAQAEPEPQPLMAEEDTLSLAASWDEDSFPTEMEEEEEPVASTVAEPSSEIASETSLPPFPSSMPALKGRAANFL